MCICLVVLANRLTVAVSDVLNPNIDDMSRGVGPLGYGTTQGDFSPQVSVDLLLIASVVQVSWHPSTFSIGVNMSKRLSESEALKNV